MSDISTECFGFKVSLDSSLSESSRRARTGTVIKLKVIFTHNKLRDINARFSTPGEARVELLEGGERAVVAAAETLSLSTTSRSWIGTLRAQTSALNTWTYRFSPIPTRQLGQLPAIQNNEVYIAQVRVVNEKY